VDIYFILPTISTAFIVLSAIFMAVGIVKIKNHKEVEHEKWMKVAAVSALLFFILYISKTVFLGNTQFGGPKTLETYYVVFLICHIILSTTGGVLGAVQLYTGSKRKRSTHRKVGRVAAPIWFFTAITGVIVYILLYVMYPGGETTGLFDAIFH
jgi:putative membrane protein